MKYANKKVVILGLGGSGEAAARLLLAEGASVTICESHDSPALCERISRLEALAVRILLGLDAETDPTPYDFAVISPGIDTASPIAANVLAKDIPLIGEIELAYRHCACPIIAITGANGKTTTTEITTHILKGAGLRTMACGNIGLPASEAALQSHSCDVLVMEVSSFQLETIHDFHPRIAAWLNLSPNHLDRYPSVAEYREAKLRIFSNMTATDTAVINLGSDLPNLTPQCVKFSAFDNSGDFSLDDGMICYQGKPIIHQNTTKLCGVHNAENIMAALAIGHAFGIPLDTLASSLHTYTPPPHRCELVATHEGITWINDSKATSLDATEKAILSQNGGLVLIAGGKDKGFGYDPLLPLVRERVKAAVLIGQMSQHIAESWSTAIPCSQADNLDTAVALAAFIAEPGDTILFSPGTSSFDMFSSYIERGDIFKKAVRNFIQKQR